MGNVRRAHALSAAVLCCLSFVLVMSITAAASGAAAYGKGAGSLSVADLLSIWGSALTDPSTYTTMAHVGGFLSFLANETFLSSLSSNTFGSLSRNTILGTIPNVFFVVCILCVLLSVAVTVMELKKLDMLRRVVKK